MRGLKGPRIPHPSLPPRPGLRTLPAGGGRLTGGWAGREVSAIADNMKFLYSNQSISMVSVPWLEISLRSWPAGSLRAVPSKP